MEAHTTYKEIMDYVSLVKRLKVLLRAQMKSFFSVWRIDMFFLDPSFQKSAFIAGDKLK